jgi:hypothetical protein
MMGRSQESGVRIQEYRSTGENERKPYFHLILQNKTTLVASGHPLTATLLPYYVKE